MNRRWIIVIAFCLSLCNCLICVDANEEDIFASHAKGAYVMEYTSQNQVYAKNENEKLYPASMTKMMSLILVYEAIHDEKLNYDKMIRVSEYAASMGGSQVFLEMNEEMSVEHLLKAVCIASANDAIVALAEAVSGSEKAFVEKMNSKAKQLKLKNTHFMNATGLHHDNHYSSPKDMALIGKALIDVGGNDLLKITSTYEDYIREDHEEKFWLVNTNKLIRQYEGVDGLKTGYTSQAKSCITVSAKRNNIRFIAVVMGEPDVKTRNQEVKELLDYSFAQYDHVLLYPKNKVIEERKIDHAKEKKVKLMCAEDVSIVYEKGKDVSIKSEEIKWLDKNPPYQKGECIAKLKIELNDETCLTTNLVAKKNIHQNSFFSIFYDMWKYFI